MTAAPSGSAAPDLATRIADLAAADRQRLSRRLQGTRKIRDRHKRATVVKAITTDVARAEQRLEQRRAGVPAIGYPAQLPVSQRKDDILAAIRDHQVVIVAGETGSGKTTQLPKICLELGLGIRGMIGHTQPRRIAARAVAERLAEELDTPLGTSVGYKVRFTDRVSDETLVKVMTDGILLAELQGDRMLSRYDTIIIDEAHERSLNIDFILGYLKQLLPRRPDLKVVITSATIDPERFSRHFGDAPIIEVSGRTYPVEVRYRPLVEEIDDPEEGEGVVRDQIQAICEAVGELRGEGRGDILVFLSGEREIRDTADALQREELPDTEIVPLYARLSAAEQHRVFQPHQGRRIVLATNVAETSLTVPGIRYVVDPGTARISRYSNRLKVQRLPIETISQASANQRKGRCGRVADGICIRLYSEDDFGARPEFTDPEILRTNLASVILQMTAIGLGDIEAFPFVDPPDRRQIRDGVALLHELGALDDTRTGSIVRLTDTGRRLAQLPIDPRLGRMVVEAHRNGCVREVTIIAAALSIQDPRERPTDHQQAADQMHARFANDNSDFLAYLALWKHVREQQRELSSNQFRRMCKREFLNYLRIREWQDLTSQLRQVAKTLDITVNTQPADENAVHLSLLPGLLSHVGFYDPAKREYAGARNARFSISPGSALFKKQPRWIVAAELVETTRLWARIVARTDPELVERAADHLVQRTYSEPQWDRKRGAIMAVERVTLYGLPLVVGRRVNYGRIDPATSRDLFIQHALVERDWDTHHEFFRVNEQRLTEVADLEHRARRRDIVADERAQFDFYDARIPAEVVSARHFDSWWKKTRRNQPDLLTLTRDVLIGERAEQVSEADYPDELRLGEIAAPLTYRFEPGSITDGVTAHVPLAALGRVDADAMSWQVPGLRLELATALIRSLPKELRRSFAPAPEFAKAVLARVEPSDRAITEALARELRRLTGVLVEPGDFDWSKVPEHLRLTFSIDDEQGATVARGKDLDRLRQSLSDRLRAELGRQLREVQRSGLRDWDIGTLPRRVERTVSGHVVYAYPALVDERESVAVKVFESPGEQRRAMAGGIRRLLLLTTPSPNKYVLGRLTSSTKLRLTQAPHGSPTALFEDCAGAAVDAIVAAAGGFPWDRSAFERLQRQVRERLAELTLEVVERTAGILDLARRVEHELEQLTNPILRGSVADARRQLHGLVHAGFVTETGVGQLAQLPRYLDAIGKRLEKLPLDPVRDQHMLESVHYVEERLAEVASNPALDAATVARVRWMIEELRVSYFAQSLGTAHPVSEKRILQAIDQISP